MAVSHSTVQVGLQGDAIHRERVYDLGAEERSGDGDGTHRPGMVVVASIVGGAAQALAIEFGELHAVPSNSPPYIFRLPLITPLHGPSAVAAVTVRRPPDTLSFVKQHVVELRLRSLTDVELEVSYGGQTLNRLLPKSELQAARTRAEMAPTSSPSLPARAKGRDRPFAEALAVSQALREPRIAA